MNKAPNHETAVCPECDNPLKIAKLQEGAISECSACGTECEIISLNPLLLAPIEEEK